MNKIIKAPKGTYIIKKPISCNSLHIIGVNKSNIFLNILAKLKIWFYINR